MLDVNCCKLLKMKAWVTCIANDRAVNMRCMYTMFLRGLNAVLNLSATGANTSRSLPEASLVCMAKAKT